MKNNILKFKIGFTLIETLVAISILTAAIAGPLVMSIKNIGTASVSQDQLVAFYLGQEVIEYVRNVRDTNLIGKVLDDDSFDWLAGLRDCDDKDCSIDVFTSEITTCSGPCDKLKIETGKYGHTGTDTSFTRTVRITNPVSVGGNMDEAQVDITMTWKSKYGTKLKTVKLQDHIFNWRE